MTNTLRLADGSAVTLGPVLARAGEGTIYEIVDHPEWVAKIFHADRGDLNVKRDKVSAMIAAPPAGAIQPDGFVVLTWPLQLIDDAGMIGYLMPRIDTSDAVEIHTVSNPVDRANPLPNAPQWTVHATWLHLVNVAANLCLAVDAVHHVGAVIGDFQERNILVSDTTRVTLVDCDSMQLTDAAGHQFLCAVGRPEYTAPELIGVDLSTTARQQPSDLFSLAVHIYQLLMGGNHPFMRGEWTGGGDQPSASTLAASGEWSGGPGSRLRTHPLAPSVEFLPTDIQRLFVRAFTDGAKDPAARPTAAEWREALRRIQVVNCKRGHQIPVETDPCPWCAIEDERARRKVQRSAPAAQSIYRAEAPVGHPAPAQVIDSPVVHPPVSGGGSKRPWFIGAGGLLVAAIVTIAAFGFGGSSGDTAGSSLTSTGPADQPSTAAVNSAPANRAMLGAPREFVNVALWPFGSPPEADHWVQQTTTADAWQFDAGQTALKFANEYLGFSEIDQVIHVDDRGDHAWVRVGQLLGNDQRTAANIHLQRIGAAVVAPWEVVGTEDEHLTLDSPAYGSTVPRPWISADGMITGVDECIHLKVLQNGENLGEAGCVMAGGSPGSWANQVGLTRLQSGALTVVAWTGGHFAGVETFAITGLRMN